MLDIAFKFETKRQRHHISCPNTTQIFNTGYPSIRVGHGSMSGVCGTPWTPHNLILCVHRD